MGREIRRVPPGWEHPRDEQGVYRPLHDEVFEMAALRWLRDCIAYDNGTHAHCGTFKAANPYYWQVNGMPPEEESYRPAFNAEATAYQVYETVSEGTPVGPVCDTIDELRRWLLSEGYSAAAVDKFVETGYAPSAMFVNGKIYNNIESLTV